MTYATIVVMAVVIYVGTSLILRLFVIGLKARQKNDIKRNYAKSNQYIRC